MIEEKRQTIVEGKSAALSNKAGDESGAALLLFPDQNFPRQMRQRFDTATLEPWNDVGNGRGRDERAEEPLARMSDQPREVMQAFGRPKKHASQSFGFDHLPKPGEAGLPFILSYAGYPMLPRHVVFLLFLSFQIDEALALQPGS